MLEWCSCTGRVKNKHDLDVWIIVAVLPVDDGEYIPAKIKQLLQDLGKKVQITDAARFSGREGRPGLVKVEFNWTPSSNIRHKNEKIF